MVGRELASRTPPTMSCPSGSFFTLSARPHPPAPCLCRIACVRVSVRVSHTELGQTLRRQRSALISGKSGWPCPAAAPIFSPRRLRAAPSTYE